MTSKRAALYVRVSTDQQTVSHQLEALRGVAERSGAELLDPALRASTGPNAPRWQIVETYTDAGISGGKGRSKRRGSTRCSRMRAGASSMLSWPGRSTGSADR